MTGNGSKISHLLKMVSHWVIGFFFNGFTNRSSTSTKIFEPPNWRCSHLSHRHEPLDPGACSDVHPHPKRPEVQRSTFYSVYKYKYTYVYIYICVYNNNIYIIIIDIHTYIYIYICIYICIDICIYTNKIYIYTHPHIHSPQRFEI